MYELGNICGMRVFGGIPDDYAGAWECLKDSHGLFFSDYEDVKCADDWVKFCQRNVFDMAGFYTPNGKIGGLTYVVVENRNSLCMHGFAAPENRTPALTVPISIANIRYYFGRYPISRLSTLVMRRNRAARFYVRRVGFKMKNVLRDFLPHNGKMEDYLYGDILSSEV